jgi:hypothetical protein
MTPDLLRAAIQERYELEARLRSNLDYQRLQAVCHVIALYGNEPESLHPSSSFHDKHAPVYPEQSRSHSQNPIEDLGLGATGDASDSADQSRSSATGSSEALPRPVSPVSSGRGGWRWGESQTSQIRTFSMGYLREIRRRATGGEIAKAMLLKGFEIRGKKPSAVVSAALTSSRDFDQNREEGGYGLVE